MRTFILFLCVMFLPMSLFAQNNIVAMEYYFDSDPGAGNGSQFTITPGLDHEAELTLQTSALTPGFHTLFIRYLNEDSGWGMPEARTFYISEVFTDPEPALIAESEYFFNSDPGPGAGFGLSHDISHNVIINDAINSSGLEPGFHNLFIRSFTDQSGWGMPEARTFYISEAFIDPEPALIAESEYFFNSDPGPGAGFGLSHDISHNVIINDAINSSGLEPGFHKLFIRSFTSQSGWGMPEARTFYVYPEVVAPSPDPIAALEYFIGDDPGIGAGTALDIDAALKLDLSAIIPTSALGLGSYSLTVRPMSQNGVWGFPERSTFVVGNDLRLVTFRLDMTPQAEAGFFNPENERVYVRGSFNNNGLTELLQEVEVESFSKSIASSELSQQEISLIYSSTVNVRGNSGDEILYRYYVAAPGDSVNGTWETGVGTDGFRTLTLGEPGENISVEPVFLYNAAPMGEFVLISPENRHEILLNPDDTTTVAITWQPSENAKRYSWLLSNDDGLFDDPVLTLLSDEEGEAAMLQFTVGGFYTMLENAGLNIETLSSLQWTVRAESANLTRLADEHFTMVIGLGTSIDNGSDIPAEYSLRQNYPNPFNPTTVIRYDLSVQSNVQLEVYNLIGQRVALLVSGQQSAGRYSVNFDGNGLSSGLYIYRLRADSFVETRKMMLVK